MNPIIMQFSNVTYSLRRFKECRSTNLPEVVKGSSSSYCVSRGGDWLWGREAGVLTEHFTLRSRNEYFFRQICRSRLNLRTCLSWSPQVLDWIIPQKVLSWLLTLGYICTVASREEDQLLCNLCRPLWQGVPILIRNYWNLSNTSAFHDKNMMRRIILKKIMSVQF